MVNLARKPNYLRRWLLAAILLFVLIAAVIGGPRAYRKFEPMRLAKQARALAAKGDIAGARLCLRRALGINPNSLECTRVVAEIAEVRNDPAAVAWRERLVDMLPGSLEVVLQCARTATRFGDFTTVDRVLSENSALGASSHEFQTLAGRAAIRLGQLPRAIECFDAALRLDATDERSRLEHAAALLARGWLEDRAAAHETLNRLKPQPQFRVEALRVLIKDAAKTGEMSLRLNLARELSGLPEASFEDRLELLQAMRRDSELFSLLEARKKEGMESGANAAAMVRWMNRNGFSKEAVDWARELSPTIWDVDLRTALGASLLAERDWEGLEKLASEGDWRSHEYLRHALLARASRERGKSELSLPQWEAAVNAAGRQPGRHADLAKLASDWGWKAEARERFRALLKFPSERPWAARELLPLLATEKDTLKLWDAMSQLVEADPHNDAATNNLVMYSLLLEKDVPRALSMAEKLSAKHPREAKYTSTYAYSLYVRGRATEARRAMETLDPGTLEEPDVAAYYAVILAACGDIERVSHFLDLGMKADLLPEERELMRRTRELLDNEARKSAAAH